MNRLKSILERSPYLYRLGSFVMRKFRCLHRLVRPNVKVVNHGLIVSLNRDCLGVNNTIYIMGGGYCKEC